ncbi:hypothetical protein BD410DRAFT_607596 [Rickenella mellea]|uniref:Uncharacterized protein n=1 Tax=Rickenella mellea TaxID=50990 RepID=A0A4Y7QEE6_9AGAM|nr:hypothetical protein BD410DRAFT_607596 [Rickenella mellea]
MAGANYMGGKRSYAKARAKDTTGRTEKGHFLRQRHQILSRKLKDRAEQPEKRPTGIGEICFAHAKNDVLGKGSPNLHRGQISDKSLPSTTTHSRFGGTHSDSTSNSSRSSRSKPSKVLEMFDTYEPIALRATMDRIMHLPDLAGLSQKSMRPRRDYSALKRFSNIPSVMGALPSRKQACPHFQ